MSITNRDIDQAFSNLKGAIPSALREDFFGLLYLEREFKLSQLATTRARLLIASIVTMDPYAENARNENYGFLRTQTVFNKCMKLAYDRWRWVHKRLR